MTDEVWRREAVESPCIKLCVVAPGVAALPRLLPLDRGDRRLGAMTPEARRAVMAELPGRGRIW